MDLAKHNELTVRIAYNLFTQNAKKEIEDFAKWVKMTKPGEGDDFLRVNGAGEMLVFSAADFEDFLEPRPDLPDTLEAELEAVVRLLVAEPLAVPSARDVQRVDRALPERIRARQRARFRSTACAGSSTIARPSRKRTSTACARSAAASRSSTAWPFRASTSSIDMAKRPSSARRRSATCSMPACRSARARTRRASRASTRSCRCTGWCRARRSAAPRCIRSAEPARPHGSVAPLYGGQRLVLERRRPQRRTGARPVRGLRGAQRRLLHGRRKPHQVPRRRC